MKPLYLKILALFFFAILLSSNVLNLHAYSHHNEVDQSYCQNDNDETPEDDAPCELCFLVLNLNDLDYNNTFEFSFKIDTQFITYNNSESFSKEKLLNYKSFLDNNQNKAPPYFI